MQTIKILHRHTQEVLFECEVPKHHNKGVAKGKALLKAIENSKELNYANLRGCVLRGGELSGAQLKEADFTNSDMFRTDFYGTNLEGADFTNAVLVYCVFDYGFAESVNFTNACLPNSSFLNASLRNANFTDAKLKGVIGDGLELFSIQTDPYPITVWGDVIQIGCQRHYRYMESIIRPLNI